LKKTTNMQPFFTFQSRRLLNLKGIKERNK
jgi:hypothetical protein